MCETFKKCYSLINIDLSIYNSKNAIYINSLFNKCYSLSNIDLSIFNSQNVIKIKVGGELLSPQKK